jgi:acetyl esterase/lipase
VEDAKSAVRWLRQHSKELGIDADKVVASGGSAGGHIAACTALIDTFDAETDEKSFSAKPNAMVLFNPALNIDELAEMRDSTDEKKALAKAITPNRFINANTPPAIIFFGTADKLKAGADQYLAKAKPLNLRAELWTAEGESHGFFNRAPWTPITTRKADEFLVSLDYLKGVPAIKLAADAPKLMLQK